MLIELFIFLLGICIGSFLNVVIYRYNTGWKVTGRSKCLSCGKTLSWHELIPVVSFILLRGRCAGCKSKFSWQYPFVEILTGALFIGLYEMFGLSIEALYGAFIWSILVVIFVYDLRHKIIPEALVYTFIILGLGGSVVTTLVYNQGLLMPLLAGPAVALPFLLIWFLSRGTWMGFGDVKLALGIGWLLGLSGGFAAVTLAFWIGAVIGIILMSAAHNRVNMRTEIPFAPFLIIGIAIVYFGSISLYNVINIFSFI